MCGAVCVFCFFHSGIGVWQTSANAATAFACEQSYFIHRRKAIIFRIEMLKGISSDTPDRILPLQLRQIKATDLAQVWIGREKLLSAHTTRYIAPLSFIFFCPPFCFQVASSWRDSGRPAAVDTFLRFTYEGHWWEFSSFIVWPFSHDSKARCTRFALCISLNNICAGLEMFRVCVGSTGLSNAKGIHVFPGSHGFVDSTSLLWPTKAPFSLDLNRASLDPLFFCVYFLLTDSGSLSPSPRFPCGFVFVDKMIITPFLAHRMTTFLFSTFSRSVLGWHSGRAVAKTSFKIFQDYKFTTFTGAPAKNALQFSTAMSISL